MQSELCELFLKTSELKNLFPALVNTEEGEMNQIGSSNERQARKGGIGEEGFIHTCS